MGPNRPTVTGGGRWWAGNGGKAVSDESAGRIRGDPGLDLGVGEYSVGSPDRVRDWDEQLTASLRMDAYPGDRRHCLDVERADDGRLLEVVEGDDADVSEWVGDGRGRRHVRGEKLVRVPAWNRPEHVCKGERQHRSVREHHGVDRVRTPGSVSRSR